MSIYNNCQIMELEEADGAVSEHLSMHEAMVPEFINIKTYKYIVQEGDRVDRIAKALLGSTEYWKHILLVNPQYMDPTEIQAGDIIQIPEVNTLD